MKEGDGEEKKREGKKEWRGGLEGIEKKKSGKYSSSMAKQQTQLGPPLLPPFFDRTPLRQASKQASHEKKKKERKKGIHTLIIKHHQRQAS